ncbi:site-specific integrase [Chitinophaga agrisoli]|uniref:Site-specific integrase n=1 Tax=Chitinophaga agrisoli TaxID=2607653 RepID=A0A5B2VX17_9BACT|nr:site-specific integrase [Chitinophaga agrisoli]KAA2242862.1 site-specific integrase [Chitinophaga agrisoli]
MANITISSKTSRDKAKVWYYLEWGKGAGQRKASGIYTWAKPKDSTQKQFNKDALAILETKRSQMTLDLQAIASGHVPAHKLKSNFFDYFQAFVSANERPGNRSLSCCLEAFKKFHGKAHISAGEITENLCERFRSYLLDNLNGETPADYFMRFKRVMKAATKEGYFRINPAADVKTKAHPSGQKDILEASEYIKLMKFPCSNQEVKKAAIFSLYTGLRWCDVEPLEWVDVKENSILLKAQKKTGFRVEVPLHENAKLAIGERSKGRVFNLPTADGANKSLKEWVKKAGIAKHITWHSLRHSMSVLLQDAGVDVATVAGLLGHTTTKYVHKTYQRYKKKSGEEAIKNLPS